MFTEAENYNAVDTRKLSDTMMKMIILNSFSYPYNLAQGLPSGAAE